MEQFILVSQWVVIFIILSANVIVFLNMKNRAHYFLYMNCVSMLICATGYLLMLHSLNEDAYFTANIVNWCGKVWVSFSSLLFCECLCKNRIPKLITIIAGVFATATVSILLTTKGTGLFYEDYSLTEENGLKVFTYTKGIWYRIWTVTLLCMLVMCLVMLIRSYKSDSRRVKRKQYVIISAGLVLELFIGVLTSSPIGRYYDFNQIGFALLAIIFLYAIFRIDLLDIESITKEFVIDDLSAGVIAIDDDGEVAYYNKKVEEVFPEIRDDSVQLIGKVKSSIQTSQPIEDDGRLYSFEEKHLAQKKGGDSIIYVMNDSTDHYRHVRELEEQKTIAEDANKAKSFFLASMSHEIRTPINTILGMDDMILQESTDEDILDYATDIHTAGRTLLSLINDILDLSKIESGKLEIIPVEYDFLSQVYEVVNMIRFRAEAKDLCFEVNVSPDIPSVLFGDDIRIRQIVMNLLTNAVKYTQSGYVWLKINALPTDDSEDQDFVVLHFEVADTGRGIKKEDMARLFSEYERIEDHRNRAIEGTGLGISITTRLLELMDSKLCVDSEYQKGSVFSFDLKQRIIDRKPIGPFDEKKVYKADRPHVHKRSFSAPDARILVVDDNEMNRKVFVSLLKKSLIGIEEAADGEEAVLKASVKRYDIIFMDHMMPGMDGVEAMKRIRDMQSGPNAKTPIIVLTANAVSGSKEKYLEEGFDGYLSKPVSAEMLESTVFETLPEELLKPAEDTGQAIGHSKETFNPSDIDDYPQIFGVDWSLALLRMQNKDLLDAVIEEFVDTIDQQADKLQE